MERRSNQRVGFYATELSKEILRKYAQDFTTQTGLVNAALEAYDKAREQESQERVQERLEKRVERLEKEFLEFKMHNKSGSHNPLEFQEISV